jgi:hypothetical protein
LVLRPSKMLQSNFSSTVDTLFTFTSFVSASFATIFSWRRFYESVSAEIFG